ncbi:MAG: DUF512 domain-containing protein [Oscillospiraceae bacterium]
MAVIIEGTEKNSIAQKLGICAGSELVSINGKQVNDVLDYGFYSAERELTLLVCTKDGMERSYFVKKGENEQLGIESKSFLMDSQHRCQNNCIFCFIDQLPKGMRETLYFKDDDERMSFLFGNYITLTNLGDAEIDRIIEMKISPVNISVHTVNPQLRCKMMNNRFAGDKLEYLYKLAKSGVEINCQLVLCRGYNDGEELEKSLDVLTRLYPSVHSIACVPVGLSGHREGLCELSPFDRQAALETLEIIEAKQSEMRKKNGLGLVYAADEFYLLAGREIPQESAYDELLQLENGVGMLAVLKREFCEALSVEKRSDRKIVAHIVTGEAAKKSIEELIAQARVRFSSLDCEVTAIKNNYFGGNISVSGLVTATDIAKQLAGREIRAERLLIPANMLRREGDMFLDSITIEELGKTLNKRIRVVSDGADLIDAILGR